MVVGEFRVYGFSFSEIAEFQRMDALSRAAASGRVKKQRIRTKHSGEKVV